MATTVDPESLQRLFRDAVAQSSPDLHTVTAADGRYQFVSEAGLGTFGWVPLTSSARSRKPSSTPTTSR